MTSKKSQPKHLSEKRNSNRQDLQLLISYTHEEKTFSKFSFNLSPGGMFIASITPLQPGSKITLFFELPHNKLSFSIEAEVTWTNYHDTNVEPIGMGVKFLIGDQTVLESLQLAIHYYRSFLKKVS